VNQQPKTEKKPNTRAKSKSAIWNPRRMPKAAMALARPSRSTTQSRTCSI